MQHILNNSFFMKNYCNVWKQKQLLGHVTSNVVFMFLKRSKFVDFFDCYSLIGNYLISSECFYILLYCYYILHLEKVIFNELILIYIDIDRLSFMIIKNQTNFTNYCIETSRQNPLRLRNSHSIS